jgi:hypothetical protein
LFLVCVTSILLSLASHTATMGPLTATQQIATLPIQMPPKERFKRIIERMKSIIKMEVQTSAHEASMAEVNAVRACSTAAAAQGQGGHAASCPHFQG